MRALAAGGMGTVYEAEQIATGARRALKVMHGLFARDEALRARFAREARLAASVPSEHVAQILDAGQDEATGSLFIVMELLEGSTLSREIRRHGPRRRQRRLKGRNRRSTQIFANEDLKILKIEIRNDFEFNQRKLALICGWF